MDEPILSKCVLIILRTFQFSRGKKKDANEPIISNRVKDKCTLYI